MRLDERLRLSGGGGEEGRPGGVVVVVESVPRQPLHPVHGAYGRGCRNGYTDTDINPGTAAVSCKIRIIATSVPLATTRMRHARCSCTVMEFLANTLVSLYSGVTSGQRSVRLPGVTHTNVVP